MSIHPKTKLKPIPKPLKDAIFLEEISHPNQKATILKTTLFWIFLSEQKEAEKPVLFQSNTKQVTLTIDKKLQILLLIPQNQENL